MPNITDTDLTRADPIPGSQVEVDPRAQLEPCSIRLTLPRWLGGSIEIVTETRAGAVMISSFAVLLLAVSAGLVAGIAKVAGLSGWPLVATALVTPALYGVLAVLGLAYVLGRQARDRRAR